MILAHRQFAWWKPLVMAWIVMAVISFSDAVQRVKEGRAYRDLMGLTPFHSVHVTASSVSPHGIWLRGTLIKRRCEFRALTAYGYFHDLPARRLQIDLSREANDSGDRPSFNGAQSWGPWVIGTPRGSPPASWAIYAHHKCPEQSGEEINLFASGPWADFEVTP